MHDGQNRQQLGTVLQVCSAVVLLGGLHADASRHLRISSGGLPPRCCKGGRSPATCFVAQTRKCVAKGCRSIETRREIAARKFPAKGQSIWARCGRYAETCTYPTAA